MAAGPIAEGQVTLHGRLVFRDSAGGLSPIRHAPVHVEDHHWYGLVETKRIFVRGSTDNNGNFSLSYDPSAEGGFPNSGLVDPSVIFYEREVERPGEVFRGGSRVVMERRSDLEPGVYDLGTSIFDGGVAGAYDDVTEKAFQVRDWMQQARDQLAVWGFPLPASFNFKMNEDQHPISWDFPSPNPSTKLGWKDFSFGPVRDKRPATMVHVDDASSRDLVFRWVGMQELWHLFDARHDTAVFPAYPLESESQPLVQTDPDQAFVQGFGCFIAALLKFDPFLNNLSSANPFLLDIELNHDGWGAPNANVDGASDLAGQGGELTPAAVAAMLWDLIDATHTGSDAFDCSTVPLNTLVAVLDTYKPDGYRPPQNAKELLDGFYAQNRPFLPMVAGAAQIHGMTLDRIARPTIGLTELSVSGGPHYWNGPISGSMDVRNFGSQTYAQLGSGSWHLRLDSPTNEVFFSNDMLVRTSGTETLAAGAVRTVAATVPAIWPGVRRTGWYQLRARYIASEGPQRDLQPSAAGVTNPLPVFVGAPDPDLWIYGNDRWIPSGDTVPSILDGTDFGIVGTGLSRTFTIRNNSSEVLTLTGGPGSAVALDAPGGTPFSVSSQPLSETIPPGGSESFEVFFLSFTEDTHTAVVRIASNDPDTPEYTFTLRGRGTGSTNPYCDPPDRPPVNAVANPEFELPGPESAPVPPGTEVRSDSATPSRPSAAASWTQTLLPEPGAFFTTTLLPSTNLLGGSCGNMMRVFTNRDTGGSSASYLAIDLPAELPVGSVGGIDLQVIGGTVTAGFAVDTATGTVLDSGSITTGPTGGWTHFRFTNGTIPSRQIRIQIAANGGEAGEVYIDNVTARAPNFPRRARYDYTGAFKAPERWISFFCLPEQLPAVGDFNGDGFDDVATFLRGSDPAQAGHVRVALNACGPVVRGFAAPSLWHGYFCVGNEQPAVGDFDGDGRDDIVTFVPGSGRVWVALSNGTAFCGSREWYDTVAHGPFWQTGDVPMVGDFNGDGLDDLVTFTRGATSDVFVALNTGRGFSPRTKWHDDFCPGAAVPKVGDCDGDGRCDIVAFLRDTPGELPPGVTRVGKVDVALASGTGFSYGFARFWNGEFAPAPAYEPLLADLNGDGCMDIAAAHTDGRVFAAISHPDLSFGTGPGGTDTFNPHWEWLAGLRANGNELPLAGRFDGDLNHDLCLFTRGERPDDDLGAVFVALNGDEVPDVIDRVDAPAVAVAGSQITVQGLHGSNAWWRTRLLGPDGTTAILPNFVSNDGMSFTVALPTGCYPSGLYRLVVFEEDPSAPGARSELSSTSSPVQIVGSFEQWQNDHFAAWERASPSISDDAANPDYDNLPNLGEFLFGTDPRRFEPSPVSWETVAGDRVASFQVRGDRGCIRVTLENSDELLNWRDRGSLDFDGTAPPGSTVSAFLPGDVTPIDQPRLFARLRFTRFQMVGP